MIGDTVHGPVLFKTHVDCGDGLTLLARNAFDFLIDLVAGGVNGLLGGNFRQYERGPNLALRLILLRLHHFSPIDLQVARIDAVAGHGAKTLLDPIADLALDEGLGHRELVGIDQFIDDAVLGLFLGLMLALALDAFADGCAKFLEIAIIAKILREFVV